MAEHGQARATSSVARGASRGTAPPQPTPLAPGGLLDWPTPACPFTRVVADGGRHADCGREAAEVSRRGRSTTARDATNAACATARAAVAKST